MFLFIGFAIQNINCFIAEEYETITRFVTMTIVFNAGRRIFKCFTIEIVTDEVVDGSIMFGRYAIGLKPVGYTLVIATLFV